MTGQLGDMIGTKVVYKELRWDVTSVLDGRMGLVCLERMDRLYRRRIELLFVLTPVVNGTVVTGRIA